MPKQLAIILVILMIVIGIYSFSRFAWRYLGQFNSFMFVTLSSWNKHIDRPRIYLHIIGFFLMAFSYYALMRLPPTDYLPPIISDTIFFLLFVLGGLVCHFTWTKKFKETFIPKIQEKLNPISKLKQTIYNQNEIKEIFHRAKTKGYLSGNLSSFESLVRLEAIAFEDRINWIHKSPTNKNEVNRQSLIELLSSLFVNFESLKNSEIIKLCAKYFCTNNIELKISSKNVSDWRTNNSRYLKEISNIIKG